MTEKLLRILRDNAVVIEANRETVEIGRASDCGILLDNPGVSGRHGRFIPERDGYSYRDSSRNGSYLHRGEQQIAIHERPQRQVRLESGDCLVVGSRKDPVTLRLELVPVARRSPDTQITAGASLVDIEGIHRKVEEDRDALVCLYKVVRELIAVKSRRELFEMLSARVLEYFSQATHVTIFLGRPDGSYRAASAKARAGSTPRAAALSRTLLRHMAERREAILFHEEGDLYNAAVTLMQQNIRAGICVPLWDRDKIRGVLQVDSRGVAGDFDERHLELLTLIGAQAAIVLSNLELVGSLHRTNRRLTEALHRVDLLGKAKEHLAKYVPLAISRRVDEQPDAIDASMVATAATILFLDIGGYTKLTEALSQKDVGWLVETYFSAYIDAIQANGGDVNETAGDGLMIIFRSQDIADHPHAAVRTAIAVRRETQRINRELENFESIDVNIGIESGHVTVGSRKIQGLAGARWTYTATGMVTNLAARIAAHAHGGQILVGPAVAREVGSSFRLKERDPVQFKNVSRAVVVHEVRDGL